MGMCAEVGYAEILPKKPIWIQFHQMLNGKERECDILKILCGYREEKQTKAELRYSKLMYMLWQGGTNFPAH